MGMIKCPIHGLTHMGTACTHVGDAVDANRFERAYVVIDGSNTVHLVCEGCRAQAVSQFEAATKDSSNWGYLQLDPPVEPYCHQHLVDWYSATGQGDLLEAIARARARSKP